MSRRPALVVFAAVSVALLSACGTGLHAKTYSEHGREDGTAVDVGGRTGIAVRDLHLSAPTYGSVLTAGSAAMLTGGLVNDGPTADTLTSASSDVAASTTLMVGSATVQSVAVPAMGAADQSWAVRLDGLSRDVHVAEYVSVTLVFEHAGSVTLQVPVRAGDNGLPSRSPEQDPYGEHA